MPSRRTWSGLILAGFLVALMGRVAVLPAPIRLRTWDINRDGRPDLWQYFDNRGALVRASVDTNFDGRSDVQESYENGRVVRRESDRNFDDQVDLTDEFDATTGEHTRSVADVDFDGRADLLVLFADGQPVFSDWAHPEPHATPINNSAIGATGGDRGPREPLRALDDPFSTGHRLRADARHVGSSAGSADIRSIPAAFQTLITARRDSRLAAAGFVSPASFSSPPSRSRGPPLRTVLL